MIFQNYERTTGPGAALSVTTMPQDSITTTLRTPPGRAPARPAGVRPVAKAPATTAGRNGGAAKPVAAAKPVTRSKPAARPKLAIPAKRSGTHEGRLTIAILAGLAIGLVTLVIYNFSGPTTPWVFDSPKAQLPSLQAKHTLY